MVRVTRRDGSGRGEVNRVWIGAWSGNPERIEIVEHECCVVLCCGGGGPINSEQPLASHVLMPNLRTKIDQKIQKSAKQKPNKNPNNEKRSLFFSSPLCGLRNICSLIVIGRLQFGFSDCCNFVPAVEVTVYVRELFSRNSIEILNGRDSSDPPKG
ncbi:hypothetical protein E2542_SST04025 [Spatholobus suberectus]|nr:hypothetical protein E2542_SST04025 [Spatholobus suberectus]